MTLTEYRRKRDFRRTAEPRGKTAKKRRQGLQFVVQKHDASRLHYDFRLELDGVLKSWAVPKGPDVRPGEKRLAVMVEDHPLEYGKFEGIIPEGEYGGGTVLLWDRGTWEPVDDAKRGLRDGRLKFSLHGEKLRGGWMLVRRGGWRPRGEERNWFLFKELDEFADPKLQITEEMPRSVATDRDLNEIADQADLVWGKNGAVAQKKSKTKSTAKKNRTAGKRPPATSSSRVQTTTKTLGRPHTLRAAGTSEAEVAGIRLTHSNKLLYPDAKITKLDLAHYYEQIADWILPHVVNRPLAIVRCPAGNGKPCFFQKHPGVGPSPALLLVDVSESKAPEYHLAVKDLAGLIALVQMGVLEIHTWGSTINHLQKPDRLVFDLDPDPTVPWSRMVTAAREVRLVLEELDLVSFLKTTGGKGLHLVVPIQRRASWDDVKKFCRSVAEAIVAAAPDRYVATMSKAARRGKIFIDYLRNGRGATSIAPYSTRARDGATVSVPIAWNELSNRLTSDHFHAQNLLTRLRRLRNDPWSQMASTRQSITKSVVERLRLEHV